MQEAPLSREGTAATMSCRLNKIEPGVVLLCENLGGSGRVASSQEPYLSTLEYPWLTPGAGSTPPPPNPADPWGAAVMVTGTLAPLWGPWIVFPALASGLRQSGLDPSNCGLDGLRPSVCKNVQP